MPSMTDLADIEEICRLKARYFRYLDAKNWEGWRNEVLTADASMDVQEGQPPVVGIDNIIAMLEQAVGRAVTAHHGHMPEIDLTGPDTANGIWAMEDIVRWPADAPAWGKYTELHGAGHYIETYVRGPSGWRIKTVQLTRLFADLS